MRAFPAARTKKYVRRSTVWLAQLSFLSYSTIYLQAILELPTVVRGHGGLWAGQRGQQSWSESVDGEEFLESLLLVVLRARVRKNSSTLRREREMSR